MTFRVLLTKSVYIDPPGPGRLKAGTWVTDNPVGLQPGDVLWLGGDPSKVANRASFDNYRR
jgi:hypothetical protein